MTWWPDADASPDRIPISALEHHAYCPRQAALIHVEGVFTEDVNTTRGHLAHDRVDRPGIRATASPGMRQHYAVPVWSAAVGLYGRCDVIETDQRIAVPIEHKIGEYHPGGPADVQVAAQALCLREMLDLDVPLWRGLHPRRPSTPSSQPHRPPGRHSPRHHRRATNRAH